jgi:hypothetical protein
LRQDLIDFDSLHTRLIVRWRLVRPRRDVSDYGFIALDSDHPTDLIQAEHAHCEAQHYLGVSADDGIEVRWCSQRREGRLNAET